MLNEVYEHDQYMTRVLPDNLGKPKALTPDKYIERYGTRLGYRRLVTKKEMEGLKRPLILIARDYLTAQSNKEDKEKSAVECLKSWCGMTKKINDQYKNNSDVCEMQDLLPDYIEFVLGYEKENKKVATQKRRRELTNKEWAKSAFDFDIDTSDYHGISFERIVAEALVCNEIVGKGLDRYYLLSTRCTSEEELFKDIYWSDDTVDFIVGENSWTAGRKNKILMAVAVKLMKNRTEHSRWFPKVDFENWIQNSSGNSNKFNRFKFRQNNMLLGTVVNMEIKEKNSGNDKKNRKDDIIITIDLGTKKISIIKSSKSKAISKLKIGDKLWIRENVDNDEYKMSYLPCLFTERQLISSQKDKELIINEEWSNRCGWKIVTKEELKDILLGFVKNRPFEANIKHNTFPVFYRDYYFEEDNCKESGIFLQQNQFYYEEKEFWEKAAKENEQLTGFVELCKRSFDD